MDYDSFLFRVLPRFLGEILRKYFRVEVVGLENIPRTGPVIIAPNHSGFSGFDAIVLNHVLINDFKRVPRILMHHLWFLTPTTSIPASKLGFVEANYENGVKYLSKKNMIVLFPEGEHGNFKPSSEMYQLQEFKRGFVRMALESKATIVPTLIIGAEESNINLKTLKLTRFLRGPILPLPLNIIPLPVKWKIIFLPPIRLPFGAEKLKDREFVKELAQDIQESMQKALRREVLKKRS